MICLFIVILNKMMKYRTRMGQNTGMLKMGNRVNTNATTIARVPEYLQPRLRQL